MKKITRMHKLISALLCAIMIFSAISSSGLFAWAHVADSVTGDADKSGTVRNADLSTIVRYLSGWKIEVDTSAADYDKNGKVNNRDAIALIADLAQSVVDVPAMPEVSSSMVGYIAYGSTSGLCTSLDTNDGLTDTTSKAGWGLLSGSGVMSVVKDGGTVVVTGRGMFGTSYTFTKTETPVLITAKYGNKDYRSHEIVNAKKTGNGSQKGTFILGDSAVVVTFNGDYIIDDIDLFTRNKVGGATVEVKTNSRVVFGDGVNVTNMKESTNHPDNLSPTLSVESGAFVYLHTLGFEKYVGSGTLVLSDDVIAKGGFNADTFTNFYGRIVDMRGKIVVIPTLDLGTPEVEAAPAEPQLTSDTICYVAHSTTSGLCTSTDNNDGQTDTTSKYNWGKLSGKGTMSVLKDGGTAIITGRGMFGVNYTFEYTTTPVLITAVYGDRDYRSHEIVNATGDGNGSQRGTFILGDSAVTVTFTGNYILDNVDIFTRNKTGGATIAVASNASVVFGDGVRITDMTASSLHTGSMRPTLNVEAGGYAYLHTAGFGAYTGAGTIVVDEALVSGGVVTADDFASFKGRVIYPSGKDIWGTGSIDSLSEVVLEDGAIYSISTYGADYYLTADDFGVYDNALVTFTLDSDDMSQLWRAHKNEDGTYSFENMACGSYLSGVSSDDAISGTSFSVRVEGSADAFKKFKIRSIDGTNDKVVIANDKTGYVGTLAWDMGEGYLSNALYQVIQDQFFSFEKVSDGKGQYPQLLVLSGDYQGSASCPEIIYHDGVYYNYNMTGAITVKTSTDLKHWNVHPDRYAFERPSWLTDVSEEGAIWAPGCYEMNGKYYLYYCTSSSGSRNSAIGVAVSDDPSKNDWKDLGMVIRSYVYEGWQDVFSSNFNAIDPNVVSDGNGKYYLVYGSYWNGIFMRRLDPDTGMLHKTDTKAYNIARGNPNIEAAYVIKRGGYYYQFVAKGSLSKGTYYWAVGRSTSITGPYYDKDGVDMMNDGGTRLTEWKDGIEGVAHAQYFEDIDGQGYMVSESWQYRDKDGETSKIQLHISSVVWTDDGWPVTVLDPDVMGTLGEK